MTITVPDLPYEKNALEPHLSERTLTFHYEKHHKGYAKKLNDAIAGTDLEELELEKIIEKAAGDSKLAGVFNNAAQIWNHTFFWGSMSPKAPGEPNKALSALIDDAFGGVDGFKDAFTKAGETRFGSGYAWLVLEAGKLKAVSTANAETPLVGDAVPLLCCDVWEHAYYLDYQNERGKFLKTFVDNLLDWDAAAQRLADAPREALQKVA